MSESKPDVARMIADLLSSDPDFNFEMRLPAIGQSVDGMDKSKQSSNTDEKTDTDEMNEHTRKMLEVIDSIVGPEQIKREYENKSTEVLQVQQFNSPMASRLTRLGKDIFSDQGSDLYSQNPCPSSRVLSSYKAAFIDTSGWTYYDAMSGKFQKKWVEDKMKAATFRISTDKVYWVSRTQRFIGAHLHELPPVSLGLPRQFTKADGSIVYGSIVDNSTGKAPPRMPRTRGSGWVIVRMFPARMTQLKADTKDYGMLS